MTPLTPPPQLEQRVLAQIRLEKRLRQLKRKLALYCTGLVMAIVMLVVGIQDFLYQAHQTGFLDFSSLLASDFRLVTQNFSDYTLSLAESLPAVSFAFICLALLIIIASGAKMLSSTAEFRQAKIG